MMRSSSSGMRLFARICWITGCWICFPFQAGIAETATPGRFFDVTEKMDLAIGNGRAAWADLDDDGWTDLVSGGKLYRNLTEGGHWLALVLRGKPPNTSAVGAVVTVENGPRKQIRQVEAGTGSGNQNALRLHFGLGETPDPVNVTVQWPDGEGTTHSLSPNQVVRLEQAP